MSLLPIVVLEDYEILNRTVLMVDCSDLPLKPVAQRAPWALLELPRKVLVHPDLWHDGQWIE